MADSRKIKILTAKYKVWAERRKKAVQEIQFCGGNLKRLRKEIDAERDRRRKSRG